ncbi:serine hydrolase domain-containing protein [Bradyrhizobium sp. AZCC 1693]|uniref:serine hydrolase domain-containing protein n=1 Tax=Bradyrhizobium sp. AZCC 1693 TaxID=3117029 RepID=UPI002FF098D2
MIRISMSSPVAFGAPDTSLGLRSLLVSLNLVMAGLMSSAHAQGMAGAGNNAVAAPGPVFSDTGPDAAAYGAAAGFPVGTRATASQLENLVGTYSHFGEMFPSRQVRRATTPWLFKRAPEPVISYTFGPERRSIADYLSHNPTTGLLIAKDDTILYEHYQYARTDRDRLLSQSMAKTITAMLIGIAVSEGKIKSIDDPVSAYVPGLANAEYGKTSVRDLLHMSSGVAFSEIYDGQDDVARLGRDLFGEPGRDPVASVAQFNTRAVPPGTRWHYASVETEILGLVLRSATGEPVADYLHDRIWDAIGAEADAAWAIDGTGQEIAFCCFNATLRDYARLGRLLAHDGAWEGRQLIPRQWVLDATTVKPADGYLAPGIANPYFGYGYQVWIFPGEQRRFALFGIRGQTILVDPASKLVMVHTAVRRKPSDPASYAEPLALWFGVLGQLGR